MTYDILCRQRIREEQLPFVGAAVGIVIASIGVVADALAFKTGWAM